MNPSFSLLTEPWIPCLFPDGTERELSLREVLYHAPEVAELAAASPLVNVALLRFLLTILHRVYGPCDELEWERLWRAKTLARAPLDDYLDHWKQRFDLFDPARPFLQTPGLPDKLQAPVTRLAQELSSGNQPTLFDHHVDETVKPVSAAEAARLLLTYQVFCLSGSCGDGRGLAAVRGGPLAYAAVVAMAGDTLLQTLLLNLVAYDGLNLPMPANDDRPAWEQPAPPEPGTGVPRGYLDYLTWQSRRILLIPDKAIGGLSPASLEVYCEAEGARNTSQCPIVMGHDVRVSRVIVMPGRQLPRELPLRDPMVVYRRRDIELGPLTPVPIRMERSAWHSRLALLAGDPQVLRPLVLDWVALQACNGTLSPGSCYSLCIFGQQGRRATVEHWTCGRRPVALEYFHDEDVAADLTRALALSQRIQNAVQAALGQVAQAQALTGKPESLQQMARGQAGDDVYWSALELPAQALLQRLPGSMAQRDEVLRWWTKTCQHAAWVALERALAQRLRLRETAHEWRLRMLARKQLARDLTVLGEPYLGAIDAAV